MPRFAKLASYRTPEALAARADELGIPLALGAREPADALAEGWEFEDAAVGRLRVGNGFTALPMEGWDGADDGAPTERVRRRWLRIAEGGAKLLWFEATAVRHDGRANARQLVLAPHTVDGLARLRREAVERHARACGADGLVTGIQLTHSGRWSRPGGDPRPRIAYRHPWLDARAPVDGESLLDDADLETLIADFTRAAVLARDAGFDFVDVKHCHGYLAHELLSAYARPGRFGGALENRTRFLREVVAAIREKCPELAIAVRFSAFDFLPFRAGADGVGEPETDGAYPHAFGATDTGTDIDWAEIEEFVSVLDRLGVGLVCVTAGSPYYSPHIQRPAYYPPSDGYLPPEDPLLGAARLLDATRRVKAYRPRLGVVGTGFTYLQQHLPAVAAGCVERGWMDGAGLGRMLLSYPGLAGDVLARRGLARKLICRTFSDCTTSARHGLVSGCYPLDEAYRSSDAYERLREVKLESRG